MRSLVIDVLRFSKKPLRVGEVSQTLLKNGFRPARGRTSLTYRIGVQLSVLAKHGKVERVGRGLYRVTKKNGGKPVSDDDAPP